MKSVGKSENIPRNIGSYIYVPLRGTDRVYAFTPDCGRYSPLVRAI